MLKTLLVHPKILHALAGAGHRARVLVADCNFPASAVGSATAERVYLNLRAGMIPMRDVLDVLTQTIAIESASLMSPPGAGWPEVQCEIKAALPESLPIARLPRQDFYDQVRAPDTVLLIVTGEQRRFGNVLLQIGVVASD